MSGRLESGVFENLRGWIYAWVAIPRICGPLLEEGQAELCSDYQKLLQHGM